MDNDLSALKSKEKELNLYPSLLLKILDGIPFVEHPEDLKKLSLSAKALLQSLNGGDFDQQKNYFYLKEILFFVTKGKSIVGFDNFF